MPSTGPDAHPLVELGPGDWAELEAPGFDLEFLLEADLLTAEQRLLARPVRLGEAAFHCPGCFMAKSPCTPELLLKAAAEEVRSGEIPPLDLPLTLERL